MQQHRPLLALGCRSLSALAFSVMFLLVKLASERGISVAEIIFWRQAASAPALLAWLAWQPGGFARLRTKRLGSHALRAGVGMANMAILFTATSLLPLAETTTLGFTTALFAVLVGTLVLGERVGPWRWGAVLLGFAGVLVIAQPGGQDIDPLGATLALVSSLMIVMINHQIRDLSRTEEPITIVFWFGVFGLLLGGLALPFVIQPHDHFEWLLLGGLGALGFVGQMMLTASLRYAPVSNVVVMDYTSLLWTTLLGWFVLDQLPSEATWLGAPLIICAGLTIVWREHRLARNPPPVVASTVD